MKLLISRQKNVLASVILALSTVAVLAAQPILWKAGTMGIGGKVRGTNYLTLVEISDVTNAPIWKVNDDNPPLSLPKAERLAADALASTLGGSNKWSPGTVTLHEYDPRPSAGGYWIYEIAFKGPTYISPIDNKSEVPSVVSVCVMMNGKVICPQPRP